MLKKVFVGIMLLIGIVSCSSKKSAFDYSQDIVKKEQSLLPDIEKTENAVKQFLETEQYDSIASAGEKMEKLVDARMTEIDKMPAPDAKGADVFKTAIMKYFGFIKGMYTGYKNFGHAPTAAARDEEMGKLRQIVEDKAAAVTDMQMAQKKFADDNNFKLEDKTITN